LTVPAKLSRLPRVIVDMPDPPLDMVRVSGLAVREKLGPIIVTLTSVTFEADPKVPVTSME
jgi:hypothetical protein